MSMIGEYARLTPTELDRAVKDPGWAQDFVGELIDAQADEPGASRPRCLDTSQAWDTLGLLLRRIDFPIDIVHGEEEIPDADDWGYGPPRYLTPEQVRAASSALAATPSDVLTRGVTAAELLRADLYPRIAQDEVEEWLKYVVHHYQALVPFFETAAREGHAMMVWLD